MTTPDPTTPLGEDNGYEGPDVETSVDDDTAVDPDANDDLINSADADRLAADTDEAQQQ